MSDVLHNGQVVLTVESAGEVYKGSRFDWNGTVVKASYKGYDMLGYEKAPLHRKDAIYGRGMHNEFGIRSCIGYNDGDGKGESAWFPKIGTGWLLKNSDPYFFYTQYVIDPITFEKEVHDDRAVYFCKSGTRNGYGYEYTKTISLKESGFITEYKLVNTGDKPFATDEYVHNFLQPGGNRINEAVSLQFPWTVRRDVLSDASDKDHIFVREMTGLSLTGRPRGKHEFFLGSLTGQVLPSEESPYPARWLLKDERLPFSMSETGSFRLEKCDVWGHKRTISPELFFSFKAAPGETVSWSREIAFTENL
ncbi:MAG: hypothetical protein KBT02_02035 [Treponema sp.]|nr:hypothetical protein [Candidatus Treponema caballi]